MTVTTAPTARLDDIADAAARLFLEKGYDAASMSDLAAATGLGKSSLYHHLDSKDQLLAHICGRTLARLRAGLEQAVAMERPPGDRLAFAVEHVGRTVLDDVAAGNLLVTVRPTSETGRQVLAERCRLEGDLAGLVAAAQADGTVRDDVEPLLLTRLVMGTISGLVAGYRPDAGDASPDAVRSAVLGLVLAALRPAPHD